jgi:hypothetical protein
MQINAGSKCLATPLLFIQTLLKETIMRMEFAISKKWTFFTPTSRMPFFCPTKAKTATIMLKNHP